LLAAAAAAAASASAAAAAAAAANVYMKPRRACLPNLDPSNESFSSFGCFISLLDYIKYQCRFTLGTCTPFP
jgi:hypothetical protein